MLKLSSALVRERIFLFTTAVISFSFFIATLVSVQLGLTEKVDRIISDFFPTLWGSGLDQWMLSVTFLADYIPLAVVVLAVCYFLILRRRPVLASGLALVLIETAILVEIFKPLVGRLRPAETFYVLSGFAFPSGHAALSIAACVSLIIILFSVSLPKALRYFSVFFVLLSALAVIFSRVYLNVHWFTDTLGGIFLGIFSATLIMAVLESVPEP